MLDRLPPVHLTVRGWALLGVALLGLIVAYASGWPALLAVSLFAAALVAAGVLSVAVTPARVSVDRRLSPDVVEPGRPVTVRLTIGGRSAGGGEWQDVVPHSLQVSGAARGELPRLGAALAAVELDYTITGRRRGAYSVGPLRLERTDPLGVATAKGMSGPATPLTVLPLVHEVRPPSAAARTDLDPDALAVFGLPGEQRDILAREYRAGDPLRSVDWRSTAHRGELMVRAEAAAAAVSTALIFDARASAWRDEHFFEWAVQCVASLAVAVGTSGSTLRLVTSATGPVSSGADAALLSLATIAMGEESTGPAALVRRVRNEHVQVLHVLTGVGATGDIESLPALGAGAVGLVSVVGRPGAAVKVARGWRLTLLDPSRPVEEAWSHA